ncbi:protein misato homolog 1-like [Artemia franciscana]|uniref:protein misato homolog 1-like n=1 Tax=Artemia franciscana TaxID=6661 RepID=UPI0032DA4B71
MAWSAFMWSIYQKIPHPGKSNIRFLTMINHNPSDISCVYSTLMHANERHSRSGKTLVINFDQPLYWQLKCIVDAEPVTSALRNAIAVLGEFHTRMSFLGAMGFLMADSGLTELTHADSVVNNEKVFYSLLWQTNAVYELIFFFLGDSNISSTTGNRNLESHIKVWTDYLRPHFHPKSILLTKEFEYQSPAKPFNFFDSGVLEWNKSYLGEDIEDSLRFFAEGCDVLQGFQLLFDAHDGFSGVAEKTLELIHEEYGKKTTHAFPVMPSRFSSDTQEKAKVRLINIALSFNSCIEHTFFTPLTLAKTYGLSAGKGVSYVNYIDSCDYHTSAIIASALDTLTLPYRLKNSNVRWEELLNLFSQSDRKLSTLNVQFPFVMNEDESLLELLGKSQEDVWTTLCPSSKSNAVFSQSIVFRGLQDSKRRRSLCVSNDHKMGLRRDESIEEAVQRCYLNKFPQTLNSINVVDLPLKTSSPFPQFFVKSVSSTGYISNKERPGSEGVNSIPMGLSLQSGEACQSTLDILLQDIASFGLSNQLSHIRAKSFRTSFNLENDEWKEIMEKIDCYKGLYT